MLVIGAQNSSNANRLREVAAATETPAYRIADRTELQEEWLEDVVRVGVTSGASTPEELVQDVVTALRELGAKRVRQFEYAKEDVRFNLPRGLEEAGSCE